MAKNRFSDKVASVRQEPLAADAIKALQVNLGYACNMSCKHCHVSAGPARIEIMDRTTIDLVMAVLHEHRIETLDITGGAPEMNPGFRALVSEAKKRGTRVIVRTNLTVFSEQGMADLPEFYRDTGVELIASLPCYLEQNVAAVRGRGAFEKSIEALRRLNRLGFGLGSPERPLNLVYNPSGPFLPPAQAGLEADYKRQLKDQYGITFDRLYSFVNMPLGRFRDRLVHSGDYERYCAMLESSFNPDTLDRLMCRSLVSVGWDGRLYDCDFNQVLGIPVTQAGSHIRGFDHDALSRRRIAVDNHCFGCTAGQGST